MTTEETRAYSDAEWQARVELATAYRLADHFGGHLAFITSPAKFVPVGQ